MFVGWLGYVFRLYLISKFVGKFVQIGLYVVLINIICNV